MKRVLASLAFVAPTQMRAAGFEDLDFDLPPVAHIGQYLLLLLNLDEVVETVAFYTVCAAALAVLAGVAIALRERIWAGYVGLVFLALIWVILNDQMRSGIYWTGITAGTGLLLALSLTLAAGNLALAGAALPRGRMRMGLWWGALAIIPLSIAVFALPQTFWPMAANIVILVSGLAHLAPVRHMHKTGEATDPALLPGATLLGLFGAIAVWSAGLPSTDRILLGRITLMALILFLAALFIRSIARIRRERKAALARSLAQAQREAEMNRALLEAKEDYTRTQEIARLQRLQLAEASHDIRQPLTSLRTTLSALAKDRTDDVQAQIGQAFDYLDRLAQSFITEATGTAPMALAHAHELADDPEAPETPPSQVPAGPVLATVDRMFREEAEAKGLRFEVHPSDAMLEVEPLALMRVLSNLTANAIHHTTDGHVTVQIEEQSDGPAICVTNSASLEDESLFAPFSKGEASEGHGLGLSIVREQSRAMGAELEHHSTSGETVFTLHLAQA